MFDEGLVAYAEKVPMSFDASILYVTWLRELLQQYGCIALVEASLATALFECEASDPDEDAIITFDGARRQLVSSNFLCNSACKIVQACQGYVVEGSLDKAEYLI